jgi:uncharacterized membrane protein
MNPGYAALILLHILLLVYWLGADLGVFYSSGFLTNPALSVETRRTVMKILHFIDLFPRMALVMMLPVGASLALIGGYAALPDGWIIPALALVWVAAIAWLMLVIKIYGRTSPGLTRLDYVIRYGVIAGLLALAAGWFLGVGPIGPGQGWLALKLVIFAAIITCGLGIRVVFKPFAAAFGKLVTEGSSPAVEAAMKQAQTRVRPIVLLLWVGLLVEAFLGVSKI